MTVCWTSTDALGTGCPRRWTRRDEEDLPLSRFFRTTTSPETAEPRLPSPANQSGVASDASQDEDKEQTLGGSEAPDEAGPAGTPETSPVKEEDSYSSGTDKEESGYAGEWQVQGADLIGVTSSSEPSSELDDGSEAEASAEDMDEDMRPSGYDKRAVAFGEASSSPSMPRTARRRVSFAPVVTVAPSRASRPSPEASESDPREDHTATTPPLSGPRRAATLRAAPPPPSPGATMRTAVESPVVNTGRGPPLVSVPSTASASAPPAPTEAQASTGQAQDGKGPESGTGRRGGEGTVGRRWSQGPGDSGEEEGPPTPGHLL